MAFGQRRADDLAQMIAPRGKGQQHLGQRIHGFVQQQPAQLFGQWRAAGFTRQHHFAPGAAQGVGEQCDMRGLARAIDALEGDEEPPAHLPPR